MNTDLLKTKTFWGGVGGIATGIGMIVAGDVAVGIQTIIGSIIAICGRDAISKITAK